MSEQRVCCGCGKTCEQWMQEKGFQDGEDLYCCEGCAEGTRCVCSCTSCEE